MSELERRVTGEKDLAHETIKADLEHDDPEYTEYLALVHEFSGEKLKRLQVSIPCHFQRSVADSK